jgi:hypothetical protein
LDFGSFGLEHAAQSKDNLSSLSWLVTGSGKGGSEWANFAGES